MRAQALKTFPFLISALFFCSLAAAQQSLKSVPDPNNASENLATVSLTSNPDGAEINIDDSFAGNTPSTVKLKPGKHTIRMFLNDYHNWIRWITVEVGEDVHIAAALEPSLHFEERVPGGYAVLFVSPNISGQSFAFFRAPDGTAAAVPVQQVKLAMDQGYKTVTFGEMVEVVNSYAKTIQDQQKRINDLASDYDALVARFNRLAATNATTAIQGYRQAQADDESRTMRLMLFQSLLSRVPTTPSALPAPVVPSPQIPRNNNINCTSNRIGSITYTNCY